MKSNIFIITVTCLTLFFVSCTTMNVNNVNKGEALKGGWGYVIARVINPTTGKTIPYYTLNGEVDEYVKLNSDIKFENANNLFTSFVIENNTAGKQIIFLSAKKGRIFLSQKLSTQI